MPLGFVYEITPRCNLDCGFCYNVWKGESQKTPAELDADTACRMLRRALSTSDAQWLTFTGGEPLLYDDLDQVVTFVRENFSHVRLGLATNATLLTANRLSQLIDAGIQYVEISLFAADNAGYRGITRADAFDSVRQAIAQVKLQKIPLTIASILSRPTGADLETVIEIAFALGADILTLNRFVPTGRGKENERDYSINLNELDGLLSLAERKSAELGFEIAVTLPVENCLLPHDRYPHLHFGRCVCGRDKWAIDPQGRLRTCEQNTDILGNLLDDDFPDLIDNSAVETFRDNNARGKDCYQCSSFDRCGGGCRFSPRQATKTKIATGEHK